MVCNRASTDEKNSQSLEVGAGHMGQGNESPPAGSRGRDPVRSGGKDPVKHTSHRAVSAAITRLSYYLFYISCIHFVYTFFKIARTSCH